VNRQQDAERVNTIVVGGGQAGLSVGYQLARRGIPCLILDESERIGDSWRKRWDSLRLFTPARYDGLAGMRFPARGDAFITKDAMADYLESYARHFDLPVRTGVRVDGLSRHGEGFVVTAGDLRFEADNIVVAMANYQRPRVPLFAKDLEAGIVQLHSHDYKNLAQLQPGGVLIVGVGNSGAEIGMEVVRQHQTLMSGKESGFVPFRIETFAGRFILVRMVRFMGHHVLNLSTPIGRRAYPKALHQAAPLIRVKPADLIAAGVERVPRVIGARNGRPLLADDRVLDVANVIWCTGFEPGFSWIDRGVFANNGDVLHERGIVPHEPGLYFVGLHFLYAATSATITGVGRDAARVAKVIATRDHGALRGTAAQTA
jgi:putative flavoprotein involved in K+ transport